MSISGIYDYGMASMITAAAAVSQIDAGDVISQAEKLTVVAVLAVGCYWLARKNADKEKEIARLNDVNNKESKEMLERLIQALEQSNEIGRWCREHAANKK